MTAVRVVAIAAVALGVAHPVAAAALPDWAAEIERAAPALPPADDDGSRFLVLLDESSVVVRTDGRLEVRQRLAVQALRDRLDGFAIGHYRFDEKTVFKRSKAWHRLPGEKARKVRAPAFDLTVDGSFLTDAATRVLPIDGVRRGSLAFFEFEAIEQPETLTYARFFQGLDPVARARLEVAVPDGWRLNHDWPRGGGVEPTLADGRHVWELRDLPVVVDDERLGIPARSRVPFLVISVLPPADVSLADVAVVSDWTALALWYESLAGSRHAATAPVRTTFAGMPDSSVLDLVREAGRFVRDDVRYVAREVGIGGLQPRPAEQVLSEKLGDCKDKGTLFRALLAAADLPSYPVLVNATRDGTVSRTVPTPAAFDHFVVAVPLPGDRPVPERYRPAVVDAPGLGPLLIVDTTDQRTAIGSLPAYLAGKVGLVVAGEASGLLALPDDDPAAHRVDRARTTRGGATLAIVERVARFGEPAARARAEWALSTGDYGRRVGVQVARAWPGAAVADHDVEPETADGEFVETIEWSAEPPARGLLKLFPGLAAELPRENLDRREAPIVYPYSRTIRVSHRIEGVDETAALPAGESFEGPGWRLDARIDRDAGAVVAEAELTLERRRFEPDSFEDLKRLWDALRSVAGLAVRP